jgi:hypothetical protein
MQAIAGLDDSQRADLLTVLRKKSTTELLERESAAGASRAFGQSASRTDQSVGYAQSQYTVTGKEYPSALA